MSLAASTSFGAWPRADIASYDIYASTNSDPWGIWLERSIHTSAVFTGQNGNSYAFYSIAHDYVGNVETPPSSADATTTVNTSVPFVIAVDLLRLPDGRSDQLTLSFPVSAGYDYVVEYRDDVNSGTSWQPLPGAPQNSGTVVETNLVTERYYRVRQTPR